MSVIKPYALSFMQLTGGLKVEIMRNLLKKEDSKIVMLIIDGLGGVAHPDYDNKTALEAANTPNLNALGKESTLGLSIPVKPGITPGSGPAHLALFGYDPERNQIGRGVLEAYGIGLTLENNDVAARGNFATLGKDGVVVDRRAGRISSEECHRLVQKLSSEIKSVEGVQVFLYPGKEHRFVVIFRGEGLGHKIPDTDPQKEGVPPVEPMGLDYPSRFTARVVREFLNRASEVLRDEKKANGILLRGFSAKPNIEPFPQRYKLKPLALASYPMYRGITRILRLDTPLNLKTFEEEFQTLKREYNNYDFIYIHFKEPDKAGEDGDFAKKVEYLEYIDRFIPELLDLEPDVFVVTGDHSTPCVLRSHSWHPVPFLLHSKYSGKDGIEEFNERTCRQGSLGIFPAVQIMPLILANAKRLKKFGA